MNNKTKNVVTTTVFVVFIALFVVMCVINALNPTTYSFLEKRAMATFPEDITWEGVVDKTVIDQFEDFTVDQFPMREFFRYIKAHFAMDLLGLKENNGYIREDGNIGQLVSEFSQENLNHSIGRLEAIYNMYLKDNGGNKYITIVPDKGYYFGTEYGYPMADYEGLVNQVTNTLPDVEYIDIFGELTLDDYYKTDWHWDQKNLLGVLNTLGDEMGFSDRLSGKYTENILEDYRGGYWDMSGLYPMEGEKLTYLTNSVLDSCTVLDKVENITTGLYNHELYNSKTQYDFFLSAGEGGFRSIQIIENPNATTEKELIVFRDSFGSSLVPLMAEGYKTIQVIDVRSIPYILLRAQVDFEGKDVLFLYSTTTLNSTEIK